MILQVGQAISMRLLMKGNGPAQIIQTNAIWTRESKVKTYFPTKKILYKKYNSIISYNFMLYSQTNVNEDFIIKSYILNNYLVIARDQTLYECMTPVEEFTPIYTNYRWETSTNLRIFDTTCRPIPVRNCQANPAENKFVIDRNSTNALEARKAINDFIDKTLNPNRFEQLLYKVDVLMGVSCAYQQVFAINNL